MTDEEFLAEEREFERREAKKERILTEARETVERVNHLKAEFTTQEMPVEDPLVKYRREMDALDSERKRGRAEVKRAWAQERKMPPPVDVPAIEAILGNALAVEREHIFKVLTEAVGAALVEEIDAEAVKLRAELAEIRKSMDELARTMEARETAAIQKEFASLWASVGELSKAMRQFERIDREDRARAVAPLSTDAKKMN